MNPRFLLLVSLAVFLSQCESPKKTMEKPTLVIGDPIDYQNSSLMIFPVGTYIGPHTFNDKEPMDERKLSQLNKVSFFDRKQVSNANGLANYEYTNDRASNYSSLAADAEGIVSTEASTDVRNLLFYNRKTGEKYRLYDAPMHITSFSFHTEFKKGLIMYKIIKSDYNKDSVFTNADGVVLYISDKDGKNLTQISPDSAQYIDYTYYADENMLLVKSLSDNNTDHKFDMKDEYSYYKVDLSKPSVGFDIFGKEFTKELKNLIQ